MPKVSVVLVTYNRSHLLYRSLARYAAQSFQDLEVIVVDDDSTDFTADLCDDYAQELDLKRITVRKRGAGWRDCAVNINLGIRAAKGELIAATHPEVIPGNKTLEYMWERRKDMTYLSAKVYYLTPEQQAVIDTVPWDTEGALAVRELPNFYTSTSPEISGNSEYTPTAMDKHTVWESWVFGACTRKTWQYAGGFTEFEQWGAIDVDWLARRRLLQINTITLLDPETYVVHQNHDDPTKTEPTPRDMKKALSGPKYNLPKEAIRNNLW
jgi:glycosyltransferase involved in cell wall biosynthesis